MNAFVELLDEDDVNDLKQSGDVDVVEPDYVFRAHANHVQKNAPWNLVHLTKNLSSRANPVDFSYDPTDGAGVNVYVLDSGVNPNIAHLRGRVELGANLIQGEKHEDLFGHGTEVATIIAGNVYGVARSARIISVKILDKDGISSNSILAEAFNWVIADHQAKVAAAKGKFVKSIINISTGGPRAVVANQAVQRAIALGIQVFVSAGNQLSDACEFSPSSVSDAITVGSVDMNNKMSDFSNWGKCVDLYAPGEDVLTAGRQPKSVVSGTRYGIHFYLFLVTYFTALPSHTLLVFLPLCFQRLQFLELRTLSNCDLPSSTRL